MCVCILSVQPSIYDANDDEHDEDGKGLCWGIITNTTTRALALPPGERYEWQTNPV